MTLQEKKLMPLCIVSKDVMNALWEVFKTFLIAKRHDKQHISIFFMILKTTMRRVKVLYMENFIVVLIHFWAMFQFISNLRHCTKNEVFQDFFSKCDQIRRKLWIWPHLQNKSLMKSFIFRTVQDIL